ncbi:MAG: hypothetical protein QXT45_04810 [Candidatus Bilamarchaeaceae archaeon]
MSIYWKASVILRTLGYIFLTAGIATVFASISLVDYHSYPPLPLDQLGLTPEVAERTREFVASLPTTNIVGGDSDEENAKKRVNLESALFAVCGGSWPFHGPQQTGDCAAFSAAYAIELDLAVQILNLEEVEWRPVFRPAVYAQGRFRGKRRIISGQGSDPGLIADNIGEQGVLWADYEDVPPYSGSVSDLWGNRGIPETFLDRMREFTVEGIQACRTAQDVCNQVVSGHPVFFGSMRWGTTSIKLLPSGHNLARDTTNWAHAQVVTGYDGTVPGLRLFRVMNSWGPNAHTPLSKVPGDRPGGYYITWEIMQSICDEGMTFAVSGTKGFRRRDVPDFRIIQQVDGEEGSSTMSSFRLIDCDWQGIVLGIGLLATLVGSALIWLNRRMLLLCLLFVCNLTALSQVAIPSEIDFGSILKSELSPVQVSSRQVEPTFQLFAPASILMERQETDLLDTLKQEIDRELNAIPEKSVTPPSTRKPAYPTRSNLWTHPGGNTKEALIAHLIQQHGDKFDRNWLNSLSYLELSSLHSDDHEGKVNWNYARGRVAPQSSSEGRWELRYVCQGRRCIYQWVWVSK